MTHTYEHTMHMSNMLLCTQPPNFQNSGAFAFSRSSKMICGCFQWLGPLERMSFTWKQRNKQKQRNMEQNNLSKHVETNFNMLRVSTVSTQRFVIYTTQTTQVLMHFQYLKNMVDFAWLTHFAFAFFVTSRNSLDSSIKWRLFHCLVSMQKAQPTL